MKTEPVVQQEVKSECVLYFNQNLTPTVCEPNPTELFISFEHGNETV